MTRCPIAKSRPVEGVGRTTGVAANQMSGAAALSFLLNTVKELVAQKLDLYAHAKDDLKQLSQELVNMESILKDSAYKKNKSNYCLTWERQIRSIVYKAEDLIDESISNAYSKKKGSIVRAAKKIGLAESVRDLIDREIKIVVTKENFDLANVEPPEDTNPEAKMGGARLRQHGSQIDKTIVGFEDAIEELIGILKTPSSEVEAISIIGMGGLGKTTVASKIFNDPRIQYDFPVRIWITVSESYNPKDIYKAIINPSNKQDVSGFPEKELALKARERLKDVSFLLVADDVWTPDAWKAIKDALPLPSPSPLPTDKATSSKVLVTSRDDKVAASANPNRHPHRLRFLTPEESWKLLQLEVYRKENVWPEELIEMGYSIAKRCRGLPLALVVMGGILVNTISESVPEMKIEWERISDNFGEHLLSPENTHGTMDIISMSYEKLSYEYRRCFLYMGAFPEDYAISAWKLTRLWVAEEFIKNDKYRNCSPEDVALVNLNELIKRNLVMVDKRNTLGEVKRVRVHDVIRQFCVEKAKEMDLLEEIRKPPKLGVFVPPLHNIGEFRRISLHSNVLEFFHKKPSITKTRSFICLSREDINVPVNSLSNVFDRFQIIRVFEGSAMKFPKFSPSLVKLIHLRYLTLSAGEDFKCFSESICSLLCLETIVITTSSKSFDVKNILELKRLRHVKSKAALVFGVKENSKLGSLFSSSSPEKSDKVNENLQTLTRLCTKSCTSELLDMTPNLRTLGIRGDIDSILDTTCLENLKLVSKLELKNDTDTGEQLCRVPNSRFFPPNLRSLTLEATNLEWKHMVTLGGMLPTLDNLKLKDNAFIGEKWNFNSNVFDKLECLHIERSNLKDWTVSDNSFKQLRYLIIKRCKNLKEVPSDLAMKLKTLDIEHASTEAVISAVKIGKKREQSLSLRIAPGDLKEAGIEKF